MILFFMVCSFAVAALVVCAVRISVLEETLDQSEIDEKMMRDHAEHLHVRLTSLERKYDRLLGEKCELEHRLSLRR